MQIEKILMDAVKDQASDIHITVGTSPIFRINGQLHFVETMDKVTPEDTLDIVNAIASELVQAKLNEQGEVDFSYSFKGVGRFRVSIYKQRGSYALALRAVSLTVPTVDEMGLPAMIKDLAEHKKGLIIVTGPTGSGKSTTLAAMIDHINKVRKCHVITLENPIEYLHKHHNSVINQREIGQDSSSYPHALRSALRQDPDVILVGEMSDLESISIAMMAAETGHLVLTTMQTAGAVNTIDRMIESFPKEQQQLVRVQLSSVLTAIISQQLLNRTNETGRIAAIEIMINSTAVRNHIQEGKTHQITNSINTGKRQGMVSMDSSIMDLYQLGLISKEEALAHAVDKEIVNKAL